MAFKGITAFILGNNGEGGGGGGGTSNYNELSNKPQINGNELTGNKTAAQLGLLPADTDIPTKLSDLDEDTTHRTVTDLEKQSWNNKVDSVAGKGLSTNDYTDEDKTALANKVDKVTGKGLSTNDYTDGEKEDVAQIDGLVGTVGSLSSAVGIVSSKVGTLEGEMLSVQDALDTKVDKETGKGLSTNDYSNVDKAIVDGVTTALAGKVDTSSVGTANGVAGLDNTGRVPSSQLPSYVDDVLEYASLSAFPETGEGGKIYIALDTNKTYRWSGSAYVEISESLALGEAQGTAYEGNKGKANADAIDVLETKVGAIPDQIETVVKDTVGFVWKNLYVGSPSFDDFGNIITYSHASEMYEGNPVITKNTLWAGAYKNIPVKAGITYTFSAMVKLSVAGVVNVYGALPGRYSYLNVEANTWTKITATFTPDTDRTEKLRVESGENADIYLSEYQLEKGSTATSYEPYHASVEETLRDAEVIEGKNLLINKALSDTIGGVTFVVNDDKSVSTSGTSNSEWVVFLLNTSLPLKAGTYILSGCNNGSQPTYRLVVGASGSDISILYDGENTFTLDSDANIYVQIIVRSSGFNMNGKVFYPMIRKATESDQTYKPYYIPLKDVVPTKTDNSVIGTVEDGATASRDYAVGDYFIKDTILGKTKAAIASGGTFTKDTNYEETNVAKELTELYKYIGILTTPVEAFTANSLPILKRNITNAFYNGSLRAEIAAGNFKNVRPGDYIIGQATGSIYYVVECDYWLGNGDSTNGTTYPAYNTHHLGLMLFKPVGTTALWRGYGYSDKSWRVSASDLGRCPWNADTTVDPTDTEAIGSNSTNITRSYNGTNMSAYMGSFIRERIDAILLPQCFQADFGSENVLKRRNWLSNAINASAASGARSDWQGIASGSVWVDRFIDLASEVELYGSRINSSSRDDIGVQNKQLPIYRNGKIHDFYPRMDLWTKGVASATNAALRNGIGVANANGASFALWACPLGCVK